LGKTSKIRTTKTSEVSNPPQNIEKTRLRGKQYVIITENIRLNIHYKGHILTDPRTQKLAQILVNHSARIQPGDRVAIEATTAAEPLVRALYIEVLKQGGHPHLLLKFPEQAKELFTYGGDLQLSFVDELRHFAYENFESRIRVHSLTNTRALSGFSPEKQSQNQKAAAAILATQMERGATGDFKWVTTLFPTLAYAKEAGMSLSEYEDFVYEACLIAEPDPIAAWRAISLEQQRLIDWLSERSEVHLLGEDTDLWLTYAGRSWENCDGRENFPDGEIFTGPVEDSVEGTIRFSYPACYRGRQVEDVRLWFEKGKVVKATAGKK